MKLGYYTYAMIAMKPLPGAYPKAIVEDFRHCKEVVYVMISVAAVGRYDRLAEVPFESREALHSSPSTDRGAGPGVASVESMPPPATYGRRAQ